MRIPTPVRTATLAVTLGLSAACSTIDRGDIALRPRVRRSEPTMATNPSIGRGTDTDTAGVGTTAAPNGTLVRRVCRTDGWSSDWIATAYEHASGECPRAGESDSTAFTAILVRLDAQPKGATLDICADQPLPRGWELARIDGTEVSQRCPGAGRGGASAIKRIRRSG